MARPKGQISKAMEWADIAANHGAFIEAKQSLETHLRTEVMKSYQRGYVDGQRQANRINGNANNTDTNEE